MFRCEGSIWGLQSRETGEMYAVLYTKVVFAGRGDMSEEAPAATSLAESSSWSLMTQRRLKGKVCELTDARLHVAALRLSACQHVNNVGYQWLMYKTQKIQICSDSMLDSFGFGFNFFRIRLRPTFIIETTSNSILYLSLSIHTAVGQYSVRGFHFFHDWTYFYETFSPMRTVRKVDMT